MRGSSGAGCVALLLCIAGCGPSVDAPSAESTESATNGETSTSAPTSLTATATSSPGTSASSTTDSADATSGETSTMVLDLGGDSSSSSFDPWWISCDRCGPDEVCLDTCSPSYACVPIPEECEVLTCDDPDCAQALCGDEKCLGYGGRTCQGSFNDAFVCGHSGLTIECDLWSQDCPDGEKCNAWSDDNDVYDHTECFPIARMPVDVGEPCTVEDYSLSGIDDCVFGAQCLEVDPKTLTGICRAICTGSEANPSCEDPAMTCTLNEHAYGWCLP